METWGVPLAVALAVYVAVCFGFIARRNGRNPFVYGVLSIISPINLVILGVWAFSPARSAGERAGTA